MSRKLKGSLLTQTIVLLSLTLSSVSVWAQVTINPGDIVAVDPSAFGGSGGVIRVHPTTGVQTEVSSRGLFQEPSGLAIEADGNIVVADRVSGIIRVNPLAGTQSIVHAGPPLVDLFGIALEANGSILVADTGCANHSCQTGGPRGQAVYRVNPATGAVTTVSSGLYLDSPYAIDVEADGNIVVADSTSNVSPLTQGGIIRINPVTGTQTVVSQGRQDFACPFGMAIEGNGNILTSLLTFSGYGCSPGAIFRANPAIDQSTVVSPHSIGWQAPFGMAVDTDGSILVAEEFYKAIYRVNPNTGVPTLISQNGFLVGPTDVAIARATATPDPSVTKTDGVTTVTAGDGVTYTYTITVGNSGTSAATGVTLTDSWPSAFSQGAITASQGSCSSSGGNFTCTLGNLAPGASATVSVNYTVPLTAPAGTQTNTASVSSATPDSNTSNNSASDTNTVIINADLSVTNTDGVTTVMAGDGVTRTYTITVTNAGPSSAASVTLTDSWPSGFTRGATTASQGSCTSGGGNFTCSLGDFASGASATVTVNYTVPSTAPAGTQTNTASVSSNTPDSNPGNNSASDTTTVTTSADLAVTKTDGITTITILSGTQTYTITVTNAGPSLAAGVTLTDSWPGGFSRGATTPSQGTCTGGSGSFTCSLGNLAAGGSATITVNYTLPVTTLPGPQTNTVSVTSGTSDPNSGNNTASDTTTVNLLF